MNDVNVPLLAYIFVSITSLVLAYVTYNDETDNKTHHNNAISKLSESEESKPSMLPNFMQSSDQKPPEQKTSEQTSILPNFMQSSDQKPSEPQKVGGKSKKKKSKSKKSKTSKKNI